MLLAGGAAPRSIAAITFTELAAGELRQRIAHYLDALLSGTVPDELRLCIPSKLKAAQRRSLEKASELLDELTCSTIHGFCHDLLRTYSVEAAIDPGAEILDRDQADFIFDAIFDHWWRDRLDEPRPADDPITVVARKDPTGAEKLLRDFANRGGATGMPDPCRPIWMPTLTSISERTFASSAVGTIVSGDRATPKATSPISKRWPRTSSAVSRRSRLRAVVGRGAPRDAVPHAVQIVRSPRIQATLDLEARQGRRGGWTASPTRLKSTTRDAAKPTAR